VPHKNGVRPPYGAPLGASKAPPREPTYTTGYVSRLCGVAPRTAAKWCDRGMLGHYRVPGSEDRRVPRSALLAFLHAHPGMGRYAEALEPRVLLAAVDGRAAAGVLAALPAGWLADEAPGPFDAGRLLRPTTRAALVCCRGLGRREALALGARLRAAAPGLRLVVLATEDDGLTAEFAASFDAVLRHPAAAADVAAALAAEAPRWPPAGGGRRRGRQTG
jgi:two-component system response regulator RpaA